MIVATYLENRFVITTAFVVCSAAYVYIREMFVERNASAVARGALRVKPSPLVNSNERVDALVVEEELVRLIIDLNPQLHQDLRAVVQGQREVSSADVANALMMELPPAEVQQQQTAFNPLTADYGDDENVRRLIQALPSPPPRVNPLHRERLLRIFERYAKHRLPTVSQLLRRYQDHEAALFSSLIEEYGPEPTLSDQDYFHEGMPSLPEGWCRCESYRGDVYYKHLVSKKVTWSRPREGIE